MDKVVREIELNRRAKKIREMFHKLCGEPREDKIAEIIVRNGFTKKEYAEAFDDELAWPVYMDACWNRYGPIIMDRVFQTINENIENPRYMDMFLRFAEFATNKKKNFRLKKSDDFSELLADNFLNPKKFSKKELREMNEAQQRIPNPAGAAEESTERSAGQPGELHEGGDRSGDQGRASEGTVSEE